MRLLRGMFVFEGRQLRNLPPLVPTLKFEWDDLSKFFAGDSVHMIF